MASLIHKYMQPKTILTLVEGLRFIPLDWEDDLAIYTNQTVLLTPKKKKRFSNFPITASKDEAELSDDSTESKKIKRQLYNVPYIFSRVERKTHFIKIKEKVSKAIDSIMKN